MPIFLLMKTRNLNYLLGILTFLGSCGPKDIKPNKGNPKTVSSTFDTLTRSANIGTYGYLDEVVLFKDTIVYRQSFSRDYCQVSDGYFGLMGFGCNVKPETTQIEIFNYYHPKYHPYYDSTRLHSLQSITKSIVSLVYGVAITNGHIANINAPLMTYLDGFTVSPEMREHLNTATIEDLLCMRFGLDWDELGSSLESENPVAIMERSEDWIRYILSVSPETEPGSKWNYNSGASILLSLIFEKETGISIEAYASEHLFAPLDISKYYWKKTPTGLTDTEGGLYLSSTDLLKIGQLICKDGKWAGTRLISSDWLSESFSKHTLDIYGDGGKEGYGYQWWITAHEDPYIVGLGYGGQFLIISPKHNTIAVALSWNVFENEHNYLYDELIILLESLNKG